jgi:hypothetical protein
MNPNSNCVHADTYDQQKQINANNFMKRIKETL